MYTLKGLIKHMSRAIIIMFPVLAAANCLTKDGIWWSLFAWLLCFISLDLYGWLKYELLPDLTPAEKEVLKSITVETKIRVDGYDCSDLEIVKDENVYETTVIHKPSGLKFIIAHSKKKH